MSDKDTKDTYEADDSIMNPSGKGEHGMPMKRMTAFLTQAAKVSTPRSQKLMTTAPKTLTKQMTASSIQVAKVSTRKSQRRGTMGRKIRTKPTTVSLTRVVKVSILQ